MVRAKDLGSFVMKCFVCVCDLLFLLSHYQDLHKYHAVFLDLKYNINIRVVIKNMYLTQCHVMNACSRLKITYYQKL